MSVDAQRIMDVMTYLYCIYSTVVQVTVSLFLLYKFLGPSIFAGLVVMVLLIPVNLVLSGLGNKYQVCG